MPRANVIKFEKYITPRQDQDKQKSPELPTPSNCYAVEIIWYMGNNNFYYFWNLGICCVTAFCVICFEFKFDRKLYFRELFMLFTILTHDGIKERLLPQSIALPYGQTGLRQIY